MSRGIVVREAHFPGRAPIDAYGNGGFRFADMSHRGSIQCLPSGIHGWQPADPHNIGAADLSRVLDEAADIEVLLVGTGPELKRLPAELREQLRAAGVKVDSMSTGAALRTYNVLLAENRQVAACLVAVD